jgi:D-alanine-D-alanine ligase
VPASPRPPKIRLIVLFGGRSAEHEVSCVSAASVLGAVDPARYDVVPVGITAEGRWVLDAAAARALAEGGTRALPSALTAEGPELDPLPTVVPTSEAEQVVVLPLLHGPMGEDGTMQGLLELAGVPFVGTGVLGSALAMDKGKAKEVLGAAGLPQAAYLVRRDVEVDDALPKEVDKELGWPVFVKPANLGSSVGISKAHDRTELIAAIQFAEQYDRKVIVERGIVGRELECSVLGNEAPVASLPCEILPSREFYDYDDKYLLDKARTQLPADLPPEKNDELRRLAVECYRAVECEGMGRVDFLLESATGQLYINEINTIPGFTSISMYPKMWEHSGIPFATLIDRLIELALDRHKRKKETKFTR